MRKQYSATFKADAGKEVLQEEKRINQLAVDLGVHPSQLKEWKKIALQGLSDLFSRENKAGEQAKAPAQQVNELYNDASQLRSEGHPKKSGLNPESL